MGLPAIAKAENLSVSWQKSTLCSNPSGCVELAELRTGVIVLRDSQNPSGPALCFTPGEIAAFIGGAQKGEFDKYTV